MDLYKKIDSDIECVEESGSVPQPQNAKTLKKKKNLSGMNLSNTFTVFQLLDLLIVSGMNTSNVWNYVKEKLTIRLNSVADVPILYVFSSIQTISEIIDHMVSFSSLSQHKVLLHKDRKLTVNEILDAIKQDTKNSDLLARVFNINSVQTIIKEIKEILNQHLKRKNTETDTESTKKVLKKKKQKKYQMSSSECSYTEDDSSDCDERLSRLFKIDKKKRKPVSITQIFQYTTNNVKKVMKTPGETGTHLLKIEITDMKDLKNVTSPTKYWTKIAKKAYFVIDNNKSNESEILTNLNEVLMKIGEKISNTQNVEKEKIKLDKKRYGEDWRL